MAITPYAFSFSTLGSEIDALVSEMETRAANFLPSPDSIKTAVKNTVPRLAGDFHVDLCEMEKEFVVVCDLPGVDKADVSVRLINPTTLLIKTNADYETVSAGTYHLRERRTQTGQRVIVLPAKVNAEGATASFKNGIMEVTLIKAEPEEGTPISIE